MAFVFFVFVLFLFFFAFLLPFYVFLTLALLHRRVLPLQPFNVAMRKAFHVRFAQVAFVRTPRSVLASFPKKKRFKLFGFFVMFRENPAKQVKKIVSPLKVCGMVGF